MLVFLLPVLFLLVAIVINTGAATYKKTQIQAVSDAAAHAGTFILDYREENYAKAKEAAIQTLKKHEVLGDLSAIDFEDGNSTWTLGGLTISIKRGQFQQIPTMSGSNFIPLEQDDPDNPYCPPPNHVCPVDFPFYLFANAVRVNVSMRDDHLFFPVFINGTASVGSLTTATETLATIAETSKACVAPFAIPVCALIDSVGQFRRDALCLSDRNFTKTNPSTRFPGGIVPDFLYDPGVLSSIDNGNGSAGCFWDSPQYVSTWLGQDDDNWGVIGTPESAFPVPSEGNIQTIISSPSGCVMAGIGETFKVLPSGFTQTTTGDLIWNRITSQYAGAPTGSNPLFTSLTLNPTGTNTWSLRPNWLPFSETDYPATCPAFNARNQQVCNSRRFGWNGCSTPTSDPRVYATQFGATLPDTVWQVKVPLVIDTRDIGRRCTTGWAGSMLDPTGEFRIIGFVTVNFYDTDVGMPPPLSSDVGLAGVVDGANATAAADAVTALNSRIPGSWVDPVGVPPNYGPPSCAASARPMLPSNPLNPTWPPRSNDSCNIVRGRVDCSTDFIAGTNIPTGERKVRIIQ
jgi:hypothetical protein